MVFSNRTASMDGTYDDHVQLGDAILVDGHRHRYTVLFDEHFSIRRRCCSSDHLIFTSDRCVGIRVEEEEDIFCIAVADVVGPCHCRFSLCGSSEITGEVVDISGRFFFPVFFFFFFFSFYFSSSLSRVRSVARSLACSSASFLGCGKQTSASSTMRNEERRRRRRKKKR